MAIPDNETLRDLALRVDNKDVEWFQNAYRSGELRWVEDEVGPRDYSEMGRRIELGDIGWVGTTLATLRLPEFEVAGPLLDMDRGGNIPAVPTFAPDAAPPVALTVSEPQRGFNKALLLIPVVIVIALLAFLLTRGGDEKTGEGDVVASATAAGNTRWAGAVDAAGLTESLRADGPFTVFAPSDKAFETLAPEVTEALFANKEALIDVVNFHVVGQQLKKADLQAGPLETLQGSPLAIAVDDDAVAVGSAAHKKETASTNGVLHTIDRVQFPNTEEMRDLPGTVTATANEAGEVVLTGAIKTEAAERTLVEPLYDALPARVTDQMTLDPAGPEFGFVMVLVGTTREQEAGEIRAALATEKALTVIDLLNVVAVPKLEDDINALFKREPIQFDSGSAQIRAVSNPTLDKAAELLKATPAGKVLFEGHTDSAGNAAANLALSQSRAEAVRAALVTRGIDAARLSAKGFGSERPIADNNTAEGRQANRRVEAFVTQ